MMSTELCQRGEKRCRIKGTFISVVEISLDIHFKWKHREFHVDLIIK